MPSTLSWAASWTALLATASAIQLTAQDPSVVLRQGALRGMRVLTETRQTVIAFLGIPYAEAPIGDLRFSAPARHQGWNGTLSATSFGPSCPQPQQPAMNPGQDGSLAVDEDCLFVNIWSPEGATSYRPVPVVVFLEGRGFVYGSPSHLPAQDLAAEGLVVVSVAYRLNVFGFLCLEDSGSRGNMGLLDQYLALLWVRDNIDAFGGDSRTITLLGHGAGAASVALHMTSPRTLGLFQRAILMSGSAVSPWSQSPSPSAASRGVARSLGCPLPPPFPLGGYQENAPQLRPPSSPTLDCLKTKSMTEILRAFQTQYQGGNWSELPLPVPDDFLLPEEQYLPRDPMDAFTEGVFHMVPVMIGVADQDGTVELNEHRDLSRQSYAQLRRFVLGGAIPAVAKRYGFTTLSEKRRRGRRLPDDEAEQGSDDESESSSREADDEENEEVAADPTIRAVLEWNYIDTAKSGDTNSLMQGLLQMYTDAQFKAPGDLQLKLLSTRITQLFAYRFDHPGPDLSGTNYSGAGHGAELLLLLGPTLARRVTGRRFTSQEERLAAHLKRMWADFARTGDPTPGAHGYGITWRRYTPADQAFLSLNSDPGQPLPVLGQESVNPRTTELWNSFLPKLHNESLTARRAKKAANKEAPLTNAQPFRSATFTLLALVLLLLTLLVMCLVLLKRRAKERDRDAF